jgi:replicative DNA helicase
MRSRSQAAGGWPDEPPLLQVPVDVVSERAVLGSAFASQPMRELVMKRARAGMFHVPENAAMFEAAAEAHRQGLAPEPATLQQLTGGAVKADLVRQVATEAATTQQNLEMYLTALEWSHVRSTGATGAVDAMLRALQDPSTPRPTLQALARQVGSAFDHGGAGAMIHDPNVLADSQAAEILLRMNGQACFSFGVPGLDKFEGGKWRTIPGTAPGKISLVTASTRVGKTTFCVNMAHGIARYHRRRVLYCAWEVEGGPTLESTAALSLGWPRDKTLTGALTPAEHQQHRDRMRAIGQFVRFTDLPHRMVQGYSALSNARRLDLIEQLVATSGAQVVIFDMWARGMDTSERGNHDIPAALDRMLAMATSTRTHICIVQQQRHKDVEKRVDPRPTIEGIYGHAAYAEVANTVIGLHRPGLYGRGDDNVFELYLLKQRNAQSAITVVCDFDPAVGLLENGRSVQYDLFASAQPASTGNEVDDALRKNGGYGNAARNNGAR